MNLVYTCLCAWNIGLFMCKERSRKQFSVKHVLAFYVPGKNEKSQLKFYEARIGLFMYRERTRKLFSSVSRSLFNFLERSRKQFSSICGE